MTTDVQPDAERRALVERWAARHGVAAAVRLAAAEDLADAVAAEITPDNTVDTYQIDDGWDDNASAGLN
ncbi:hypothetical protein [Streptomyces sp. NPDC056543]|uniref:hypothetical protein n=1 Tax=unclassified Streptomyces TaxID=2593676 RepID=UPI0036834305